MKLSRMEGMTQAEPIEVKSLKEVAEVITKTDWSAGTFKESYREAKKFIGSELMPLDVDEGMTIEEAKETFKDYAHVIATTRSHQKEKNGVIADRFRVVLLLDEPITKEADYKATYTNLRETFPFIDPACSDGSRLFYRSINIISVNETGRKIRPVHYQPATKPKLKSVPTGTKGRLAHTAKEFFLDGPNSNGPVNIQLYKACKEAQQNGYTQEWVVSALESMIERTGNWGTPYVNKVDMKTIRSAFSTEAKHEARVSKTGIEFKKVHEAAQNSEDLSWLVDGLLTNGGISIWAGVPKAGKSTIIRQMAIAISRGKKFLDRKVDKGSVFYLALEEQIEMIRMETAKQGLTQDDDFFIYSGGLGTTGNFDIIKEIIEDQQPTLFIIDPFVDCAQAEDINGHSATASFLKKFRDLARQTGTHIMFIHHASDKNNDKPGSAKIMGSTGIMGAVDCAVLMERPKNNDNIRFLSSWQRGGRAFRNTVLKFDPKTLTYEALEKKTDEF